MKYFDSLMKYRNILITLYIFMSSILTLRLFDNGAFSFYSFLYK